MRVLTFDSATYSPLTHWNRKYGSEIWAFALSRDTCLHATESCWNYCYSRTIWKNIKPRYVLNTRESLKRRFTRIVIAQIHRENIKWIRMHTMGDFYSQEYFDKWVDIARACPSTKILVYTRNYEIDTRNAPENFIIFYSVDDTTKHENPTIRLRAITFRAPPSKKLYQHMEAYSGMSNTFVCSSRCEHCKSCWSGKINLAFPIRAGPRQFKLEKEPYLLTKGDWRNRVDKKGNPVLKKDTRVTTTVSPSNLVKIEKPIPPVNVHVSDLERKLIGILKNGAKTRADLVQELLVPRTTVFDALKKLIRRHQVCISIKHNGSRGRPVVLFELDG